MNTGALRDIGIRAAAGLALIAATALPLASQERRFQIAVAGGAHHHFAYGSDGDYVQGENDFPATPAHTASVFSLSLSYAFKPWLAVEYDGRFVGRSALTLSDPSDGDVLRCRSHRHFGFALALLLRLPAGRIRPYLAVGAGLDRIEAREETVETERGHVLSWPPPGDDALIAPLLQAGGGVEVFAGTAFGFRLDGRYILVLDDPAEVSSFSATAGLFLRL
ncbi:MAG: hypothetical protein JW742_09535 [Candidatus Aminicenantes bacterium]|nr:hypothetical protein [Candidatus Aminicenantes bacterium]